MLTRVLYTQIGDIYLESLSIRFETHEVFMISAVSGQILTEKQIKQWLTRFSDTIFL